MRIWVDGKRIDTYERTIGPGEIAGISTVYGVVTLNTNKI